MEAAFPCPDQGCVYFGSIDGGWTMKRAFSGEHDGTGRRKDEYGYLADECLDNH